MNKNEAVENGRTGGAEGEFMQTLLLLLVTLQITSRIIISPAFTGDWAGDQYTPDGRAIGTINWRISLDSNHLRIAESQQFQGKPISSSPQDITYNLDGTHIENSAPAPEPWMSIDFWQSRWLEIKNANEVELTTTYRASIIVETLILSKDALKVVRQMRPKYASPVKPPADVVWSFSRQNR